MSAGDSGTPCFEAGARIGPYQVLELLGRGGMGAVYRALDPRMGREVALKLPHRGGELRVTRALREAQASASLDHPGIVRIHEAGEWEGLPYLAYALVDGARTYTELAPTLPLRQQLTYLRDVARALGHAHARGVVHRDVKADNVLIDGSGRALLADFGLALLVGLERLTQTHSVVGTPPMMSPEQITGEREVVGPETDVWAVGVLLYRTLTGVYPFRAKRLVELSAQIVGAAPTPIRSLAPGTPRALTRICERALAKDHRDRYPTGEALAVALDDYLEGGGAERRSWLPIALPAVIALGCLAAALSDLRGTTPPAPPAATTRAPPRSTAPTRPTGGVQLAEPLAVLPESQGLNAARFVGNSILICSGKGRLKLYDTTGKELRRWKLPERPTALAVPPAGASVAITGEDGTLFWLDVTREDRPVRGDSLEEWGEVLAFHPSGEFLAAGGRAESVAVLSVTQDGARRLIGRHDEPIRSLAFSPDGALLATGTAAVDPPGSSMLHVWSVRDGSSVASLRTGNKINRLAFSRSGELLLVATSGGDVLLVSIPAGEVLHQLTHPDAPLDAFTRNHQAHGGTVRGLALFADDARLITVSTNPQADGSAPTGELRVWQMAGTRPLDTLELRRLPAVTRQADHPDPFRGVKVSPDGSLLLLEYPLRVEVWALPGG